MIAWGVIAVVTGGGHPHPVIAPPRPPAPRETVSAWLLLKAFASGCTAMTGVEAVSNGVQAFREPVAPAARKTLTAIVAILAILLAGIAFLTKASRWARPRRARPVTAPCCRSFTAAVFGNGAFYYVTIASILIVLSLSANTSFAGFPRLPGHRGRRLSAEFLAIRGRRLVYSEGVWVLAALAALLLSIFGGITDRLIPLFAVGAFLAFTLSQAGMVAHWKKTGGRGAKGSMAIDGGALATGATVVMVLTAKFVEGAWVVALLAPSLIALMIAVHRHYERVSRETAPAPAYLQGDLKPPLVVVPIDSWNSVAQKAFRFALTVSDEIQIVHVECEGASALSHKETRAIEENARVAGRPAPKLVVLRFALVCDATDSRPRAGGRRIARPDCCGGHRRARAAPLVPVFPPQPKGRAANSPSAG